MVCVIGNPRRPACCRPACCAPVVIPPALDRPASASTLPAGLVDASHAASPRAVRLSSLSGGFVPLHAASLATVLGHSGDCCWLGSQRLSPVELVATQSGRMPRLLSPATCRRVRADAAACAAVLARRVCCAMQRSGQTLYRLRCAAIADRADELPAGQVRRHACRPVAAVCCQGIAPSTQATHQMPVA